ncbi:hypothetical protein RZ76_13800 [Apilactobacillus kunkeei]|uniref:hypothetical protein n=1 Tax=Apilactobacillus kunkeei TaxID=148814 RepID=UPI0006CE6618|nr:hypothetical protein [Apilactobacillus kunkeei]KPN83312.1 hypothetical protein RZ76_13800 [Apilactobacillus kunkeei]
MKDITEIACESYKEDLRSYDNPDYVITYPKYDWKMSYVAYDAMLNELTDYHNLNQPDTDYETFGTSNNIEVINLVEKFQCFHSIFLSSKKYTKETLNRIKGKNNFYYLVR